MSKSSLLGWVGGLASIGILAGSGPVHARSCGPLPFMIDPMNPYVVGKDNEHLFVDYLFNHSLDAMNLGPNDRVVYGQFSAPDGLVPLLDGVLKDYEIRKFPNGKDAPSDDNVPSFVSGVFPQTATFEGFVFQHGEGWREDTFVLDVTYECNDDGYCDMAVNFDRPSIDLVRNYGSPNGVVAADVIGICDREMGADEVTKERIDLLEQCMMAKRCPP